LKKIIEKSLGRCGYLISMSKGRYRFNNPYNFVIFNANLYIDSDCVWYGDIDITLSEKKLIKLAKKLKKEIKILYEKYGRNFGDPDFKPNFQKTAFMVTPDGICKYDTNYYEKRDGKLLGVIFEEQELPEYNNAAYDERDYIKLIEFPSIKDLKSNKKEMSPYFNFYNYIKNKLKIKEDNIYINPSKIHIIKEDNDRLEKVVEDWIKKYYTDDPYSLQKELMLHSYDLGPSYFIDSKKGPNWAKPNTIYIKENCLVDDKRNEITLSQYFKKQ